MKLRIVINNKIITTSLVEKGALLDFSTMNDERRLSEQLLPTIDRLLKKNKLQPSDITEINLKSDLGPNFTTYRIAKSVADAWNYAIKDV